MPTRIPTLASSKPVKQSKENVVTRKSKKKVSVSKSKDIKSVPANTKEPNSGESTVSNVRFPFNVIPGCPNCSLVP